MSENMAAAPAPESPSERAARWFALRRRKADSIEEQQFADWLEADPANRRAYDEVTRSWEIAALAATDPTVVTMRSEALMLRPRQPRELSRVWAGFATAAMVLLAFIGTFIADPGLLQPGPAAADIDHMVLRTGVGQQATATLEDGSVVTLNTDTILEVNYSRFRRDVRLVAGQALFKVAHNVARPFIVAAADREVVAVGTEFDVRLDGRKVRVALLEGRVRVEPISTRPQGATPEQPVAELAPGEQLVASSAGDVVVKPANVEELTSWKSGRVQFDDTPLPDAVAEMNRYNHVPIVLADSSLDKIRISGSFRAGQSWPFAEAVGEAFSLKADVERNAISLRPMGKSAVPVKNSPDR